MLTASVYKPAQRNEAHSQKGEDMNDNDVWTQNEHEVWVDRAYFRRNSLIPPVGRFWGIRLTPPDGWIFVDLDPREFFEHQDRIWEQLPCEAWGLA